MRDMLIYMFFFKKQLFGGKSCVPNTPWNKSWEVNLTNKNLKYLQVNVPKTLESHTCFFLRTFLDIFILTVIKHFLFGEKQYLLSINSLG